VQAAGDPAKTPVTLSVPPGPPPVPFESNWQLHHNSSGAVAIQFIHASSTVATSFHDHSSVKRDTLGMGCTSNVNDVAIPKLPPPPPRQAQYRSL
jgi:hypothetical protein